jgi:hypothetical protein
MTEIRSISEWDLAQQIARSCYLRTGHLLKTEVFLEEIQRKFNPYHDPEDGRFTFGPGGISHGGATARMAKRPRSASEGYPARVDLRPYPVRVELPNPKPVVVHKDKFPTPPVIRFRHNAGLALPAEVVSKANALSEAVQAATGHQIHVTSGYRDPMRQAAAMYGNYADNSSSRYKNPRAAAEVRAAFDDGRRRGLSRGQTVIAMADVMTNQIKRGVNLSRHMQSGAIDIKRPPAHVLRVILSNPTVQSVLPEDDHIHIQFH